MLLILAKRSNVSDKGNMKTQKRESKENQRDYKKIANEVLKKSTNERMEDYCVFKNGNRSPLKIQEIERKDGLAPRYHLEALKFLISNDCFDTDAVPVVEKMVSALAVKQTTNGY